MRTVWKFTFPRHSNRLVVTAANPVVVHVAIDEKADPLHPSIWVECDSEQLPDDDLAYRTTMHFAFVGTGHPLPETELGRRHVGSCMTRDHALVWHVYEVDVP